MGVLRQDKLDRDHIKISENKSCPPIPTAYHTTIQASWDTATTPCRTNLQPRTFPQPLKYLTCHHQPTMTLSTRPSCRSRSLVCLVGCRSEMLLTSMVVEI